MSNQENPYQAPKAHLELEKSTILASRGARLAAALIDMVLMLLIQLPVLYFYGYFDGFWQGLEPTLAQEIVAGAFGITIFLLVNGFLLKNHGQTVGKRLLGISIRDMQGNLCAFLPMLFKRELIWNLVVYVPFGFIVILVDCLMVFRGDRRCLHDLVADTQVVNILRAEPAQTF